jgi:hypothetical protein
MDEFFKLGYGGIALERNEMDVKDLAPALLAVGELFENSNQILNGERVRIAVKIKATEPGSVEVLLSVTQGLLDQAKTLFGSDEVTAIINAKELIGVLGLGGVGGVVGLIKFLKKRPIKSIVELDTGDYKVEVENGEVKIATKKEIQLFRFLNIRKSIEAVISAPLSREGVDKVKFEHDGKKIEITKEEAEYFTAPEAEEELIDEREIETNLQIVNISFQEEGKWRFSDGSSTFFAEISDPDFVRRVQKNEKYFAKDDVLKVFLRRKQFLTNGQIKTEYSINKVLDHRSAAVQIKLPFTE